MSNFTSQGRHSEPTPPYKPFSRLELLVLERTLRHAWKCAAKYPDWHEKSFEGDEEPISAAIAETLDVLNMQCDEQVLKLAEIFDPVPEFEAHRQSHDYNGQIPNKRSDFIFRRQYKPGISRLYDGLVVEAKIVGDGRAMHNYCAKGLIRFVNGEYAWRMTQAFMVAYVRDSNMKLPGTLSGYLKRHGKNTEYGIDELPKPNPQSRGLTRVHTTVHHRNWHYRARYGGGSPGDIEVFHLWLSVRQP